MREGQGERGKARRKEEKKMRKKRERKEGRKERRRGTGINVAKGAKPDGKGPEIALREVDFLLVRLFYAYEPRNGLTVSPHFKVNLRCVWFGCCCVTIKDRFHGGFETVRNQTLCSRTEKSQA